MTTVDLAAKYGDTNLSNYEVFMVGEGVVNWIGAVVRLGHAGPASTLDYTTNPELLGLGGLVVRDFVAWAASQKDKAPGCEDRMREWAANAGLDAAAAAEVSRRMAPTP